MADFAYIRSGVPGWPPERQEAAIGAAGFSGQYFIDTISHTDVRIRNTFALIKRADMLRNARDQKRAMIQIASFRCLALDLADLIATLTVATKDKASIIAVDCGLMITANSKLPEIAVAVAAFSKARKIEQTQKARAKGTVVAAAHRQENRLPKLETARKLWQKPSKEITSAEIAARVDLTVKTLIQYLGPRRVAQKTRPKQH